MVQFKYLLTRTVSGYVYIIPILIIYFAFLLIFRKKQNISHILSVYVLCFYFFAIISATGIGCTALSSFSPEIIWIPFRDLLHSPRHMFLNVIAFVPFGIILPLLYGRYDNIKNIVIAGFLFSLCIELVQMFGWGVTEIDDLIANTLGVCVGYLFYAWTKPVHKNFGKRLRAVNVNDFIEVLLLSALVFIIMAIIQPMI